MLGKRPVSIPNLEAKPDSADGTALVRVWESRRPPSIYFLLVRARKEEGMQALTGLFPGFSRSYLFCSPNPVGAYRTVRVGFTRVFR